MTMLLVAINAFVQVTIWLAVICGAAALVRLHRAGAQPRMLLLRVGLIGAPVVLAISLLGQSLPWTRPLLRIGIEAPATSPIAIVQAPPAMQIESPAETAGPLAQSSSADPAQPTERSASPVAVGTPALPAVATEGPANFWLAGLPWILGSLAAAWAAGAAFMLARLGIGLRRLIARRQRWQQVTDPDLLARAAEIAERIGYRRPFQLLASEDLPVPVATGVLREAVAIPISQFEYLAGAEGRAVLAHELAHLRFRDPMWRLLGAALRALLWFHPLMGWLNRQTQAEAEYQCDQLALSAGVSRRGYARLLVELAELAWSDRPLGAAAIGATGQAGQLERRLKLILSKSPILAGGLGRPARIAMLTLSMTLILSLGSVTLLGKQPLPPVTVQEAVQPVPADASPAPSPFPAGRVVVVLIDGRRIEGGWLGSTPENISLQDDDGEKMIPFNEVAQIRIIRPDMPEQPRHRGADPGRFFDDYNRMREHLLAAEAGLQQAKALPHDDPQRQQLVEQAEREVAAAREPVEQFRRRMMAFGRMISQELPPNLRELAREAEEHAAAECWPEAIAACEKIRASHPRHLQTLRLLMKGYEKVGRQAQANEIRKLLGGFGESRSPRPDSPGLDRGRDYRREGSREGAREISRDGGRETGRDGDGRRGDDRRREPSRQRVSE